MNERSSFRRRSPPADMKADLRPDRVGPLGVPIPDRDSVREAFEWVTEHQQ